ncbi:MAG: COX15/CtaA family protein [Mucilaginibacter polytrichastri]|nr:COX15/CtaA family protein [Mucilaginibacter polytrichastri]
MASRSTFKRINLITIVSLFVLILAGGVVRSSGSGMGCPDWPKCFGQYIPPTDVSQLPAGYESKFIADRIAKNIRFARTLDVLGYSDLAERLRSDKSVGKPELFNAAKTWTEYVNRLVGAVCGIFILLTAWFSFTYRKESKSIVALSVFNVFLVGFQGWLGSIVVSSNLVAWIVTVHMLIALAIVAISIYTWYKARLCEGSVPISGHFFLKAFAWMVWITTILQIIWGTEVREQIDAVSTRYPRDLWVKAAGLVYENHRMLSIIVAVAAAGLAFLLSKGRIVFLRRARQISWINAVLVLLQVIAGILLAYAALPPVAQATHITLASLVFGCQFYLILHLYKTPQKRGVK